MNISFFIGGLIGGGAERVTCNLANYLSRKGHCVQIITMSESDSYPLDSKVGRYILLEESERSGALKNQYLRFCRLKRYLQRSETDVYVVMLPTTIIFLLLMKFFSKAPIIASERSYPAILPKKTKYLLSMLAKRASGWVFQTQQARDWYGTKIGNSKSTIIPNALNETFVRNNDIKTKEKIIVAVGRLCKQKNYELLFEAFSKIASKHSDYSLVVYGEGEKREELEKMRHNLNLDDRILMPGYSKTLHLDLQKATMYVLSSNYEGMPNTLIEAMALGLPCVATDCDGGGASFLIENNKNGRLVPKNDCNALADAIDDILSNMEVAESFGKEASRVCEKLAPEKIYGDWESFINEIIRNK